MDQAWILTLANSLGVTGNLGSDDVTAPRRHRGTKVGLRQTREESGPVGDYQGRATGGINTKLHAWPIPTGAPSVP